MKRVRVYQTGPPEMMKLEEAEDPRPGPGEVLVQVKAAGVNPVDTYVRAGTFGYSPEVPYTPGADAAGTVEAVGPGVTRLRVGERVYGARSVSGSYAEKALFEEIQVHPLPETISFAQGACIGIPYVTAYWALFRKAKVQPGETVLIHGASGGVGTAAVQLARQAKLTILGTAGSEQGRRLVKEQGADHLLDHQDPRHFDEIMKLTGGRGVDLILEMLANRNLGKDLSLLAPSGRVVVIGSRGTVEIDPRDLMVRDAAVLGMRLKNVASQEYGQVHADLVQGLSRGALRPVVGKELPLAEAARAHREVMEPPAHGNIVLIP
ncbi:MAG: NADPH:quinone reductase [Candidatus Omnitrophica bacterium]|nr:NADPH:quinone reductase [Candidatus Omnitrophota bacterium]